MKTFISGIIILIAFLLSGIFLLEIVVRIIKPQITYSKAINSNFNIFEQSNCMAFTLKKAKKYENYYKSNSMGYRGNEIAKNKNNSYRILFLGDSVVFGSGVGNDDETIPAQLENALLKQTAKPIEVINAGFHDGFSPDSYYAYLNCEGLNLNPDLIIVGIYLQNDLFDLKGTQWTNLDSRLLPGKVISLWRHVDKSGFLSDTAFLAKPSLPLRYRNDYLKESHFWILLANWIDKNIPIFNTPEEIKKYKEIQNEYFQAASPCVFKRDCFDKYSVEYQKLLKIVKGINELSAENNISVIFVLIPSDIQVGIHTNEVLSKNEATWLPQKLISDLKNKQVTKVIDLTSVLINSDPFSNYTQQESHMNATGNLKAAQIISSYLVSWFR